MILLHADSKPKYPLVETFTFFVFVMMVNFPLLFACQVCHTALPLSPMQHPSSRRFSVSVTSRAVGWAAWSRIAEEHPGLMVAIAVLHRFAVQGRYHRRLDFWPTGVRMKNFTMSDGSEKRGDRDETDASNPVDVSSSVPILSSSMISAIGFYKNWISPLSPPACRFVPTCSQYGVAAIKEFGPTKGAILTSWRILRCSPFGGKGYDPPKWPPVAYTYSSY